MKAYILSLVFVFLLVPIKWANADIGLGIEWGTGPMLSTEVELGIISDDEFPFELALCGLNDGSANFNPPQPEGWVQELNEKCVSDECQTGVWSRLAKDGINSITFSWSEVAYGSCDILPFSGVDTESPIIDYSCDTGFSDTPTAPSIITEANSAVIRAFALNECGGLTLIGNLGQFSGQACSREISFAFLGVINTQLEAGATGTDTYTDNFPATEWQACTIALRAQVPEPRPIPTLSEWGLIATAGVLGIIGFFALRRRKAAV